MPLNIFRRHFEVGASKINFIEIDESTTARTAAFATTMRIE
jgi:hypothetical protein